MPDGGASDLRGMSVSCVFSCGLDGQRKNAAEQVFLLGESSGEATMFDMAIGAIGVSALPPRSALYLRAHIKRSDQLS